MKKFLIINSSPRIHGNSDYLCEALKQGALEAGNSVEQIYLREKILKPCLACDVCRKTHRCVLKDDMEEILEMMIGADVLVLTSPVYFYSINGLMKLLIDRCFSRYTEMVNKELVFALTAADAKEEVVRALEPFLGFAACLKNSVIHTTLIGDYCGKAGSIENHEVLKKAYLVGKTI